MFLELMTKYEPIWLFVILLVETTIGFITLRWIVKEYEYDAQKDLEKKQRRTKTTKKTTTQPSGISTTEEQTEIIEPMPQPELPRDLGPKEMD